MARDRGLSPRIALKLSFLFCFLWAAARGQDLIPNDLQALLAIKQAFSDPNNALQSWNASGAGACQGGWAGVTCAAGEVTILQLAGLGLGGSLSDQVGQLKNLRKFNVHTNNIQGPVPASLWSLPFLRAVYLNKNGFTGEIPSGLGSSSLLQRLDFSSNQLTGSIPEGLAASTRLLYVNVSDNMLSGPVPRDWALNPSVQVVSASRNALSGPVAQRWSSYRLQVLELHGNILNGSLPLDMGSGTSAMILDLGDNDFSGKLPSELGLLTSLQLLDLSRNQLTGSIPDSFGGLSNLTYLDLSQNSLSGSIPGSLSQLPDLQTFNVSYNELSGSIPMLDQSFPSSSFVGNVGLCGGEVSKVCSGKKKRLSTLAWVGIAVGIAVCSIALCICFLLLCRGKRRGPGGGGGLMGQAGKRPEESPSSEGDVGGKLVHFDGPLAFSVDDLLRATAEVLGKSSYGTVYKATLEDGTSVAVKRLREGIVKGQREFETEIQGLGAMRHPNLLALRAYYWGPKEEKLLVYDFMPLGSLAALLHGSRGPQTPLGWSTRLKIATGTARGLAFLHAKERIVHGNLTSSNILLDRHMSPQISDYGLSRVMTTSANSTVISTAGALGYRAPELTKLKKATFKSDVYSFGVILLELLTGKAPSDPMTGTNLQSADTTLPDWVTSVVKEEWTNEVFDLDLMKESPPEDELLTTLQLAMNCVAGAPSTRPDIEEVVRHLGDLASTPSPNQQPLHARHDL